MANATLISKAPDLLQALKNILASATPSPKDNPGMFSAWERAREVVAAAERFV